jgi:cell division protein FtsI/penicillin-binding protein 2
MYNVVHGAAGTGTFVNDPPIDIDLCGKTGSAQAAMYTVPELDANGNIVPELDAKTGQPIPVPNHPGQFRPHMIPVQPDTPEHPNRDLSWYRGLGSSHTELTHGWYIGFAPRDNPKIAFCVLTEYGGSGGVAAAAVAHELLQSCVDHQYLTLGEK